MAGVAPAMTTWSYLLIHATGLDSNQSQLLFDDHSGNSDVEGLGMYCRLRDIYLTIERCHVSTSIRYGHWCVLGRLY